MRFLAFARAVRSMGPYLLSHHPHCGPFRPDVFRFGEARICIACFVGYPAVLLGWGLAALLSLTPLGPPAWAWIAGGLTLATAQGLSFAGRIPTAPFRAAAQLAFGHGIGFAIFGTLILPLPLVARWALLVLGGAAIQSLWVLRLHRLERTCRACPQYALRPRCEGLRLLDDRAGAILRAAAADPPRAHAPAAPSPTSR